MRDLQSDRPRSFAGEKRRLGKLIQATDWVLEEGTDHEERGDSDGSQGPLKQWDESVWAVMSESSLHSTIEN